MGRKKIIHDIIGKQFGELTVIERVEDKPTNGASKCKAIMYRCHCNACGKDKDMYYSGLVNNEYKSCGCKHYEWKKKKNQYRINGDVVYVTTSNTGNEFMCDIDDWEKLKDYCWSENKLGYIETRMNEKTTLFHHCIIDCGKGLVRDHINQNKLDNRKCNLRIVSYSVNNANRPYFNKTGVRGVYRDKYGKYIANIRINGKRKYIGSYKTANEAKVAIEASLEVV